MKQKKKSKKVNNSKFDFDNDVIIGISSTQKSKKSEPKKKKKVSSKKKINKKIEKPKKDKSKGNNGKILKVIIFIVLIIGMGIFLCFSPAFNLSKVIVKNNNKLTNDDVISLSGIKNSKSIFRINKYEIKKNLYKNSYIESVKIKRLIPNKVEIDIVERSPYFQVEYSDGRFIYIDKNGYVLEFSAEKLELPILVGLTTNFDDFSNGLTNQSRLNEADLERLNNVLEIMNVAKNNDLKDLITRYDVSDKNDYKVVLEGERKTIHLDGINDLSNRLLWAKKIIDHEKESSGEIYNNVFRESI